MVPQVLVIGATGRLGGHFVDALLEAGHRVTALVRSTSNSDAERRARLQVLQAKGVVLIEGDLQDPAALQQAVDMVEAVVSCVGYGPDHLMIQTGLAQAVSRAKRIRRVMPAQFGIDTRLHARVEQDDVAGRVQQMFLEAGAPATFIHHNGLASDWVASLGQLGLERPPPKSIEVYGTGDGAIAPVAAEDLARHAIRALFDPWAENQNVLIAPPENRMSQRRLIRLWEIQSGAVLHRNPVSEQALEARIAALAAEATDGPQLTRAQLVRAAWIEELGNVRGLPGGLELTALYPDLGYVRTVDYLTRYLLPKGRTPILSWRRIFPG